MKLSLSCHHSRAGLHSRIATACDWRHADLAVRTGSSAIEQRNQLPTIADVDYAAGLLPAGDVRGGQSCGANLCARRRAARG